MDKQYGLPSVRFRSRVDGSRTRRNLTVVKICQWCEGFWLDDYGTGLYILSVLHLILRDLLSISYRRTRCYT